MTPANPLSLSRAIGAPPKYSTGPAPAKSPAPLDLYGAPRPVVPVVPEVPTPARSLLSTRPVHAPAATTFLAPSAVQARYNVPASDGKAHTVNFTYDADGRTNLQNLTLVGSWDGSGHYSTSWNQSAVPMTRDKNGVWHASVQVVDDGSHPWQWGVLADAPTGQQQWAVFEENNLTFAPQGPQANASYAPTQLHRMGVSHDGNDVAFKYWAPNAQNVRVQVWDQDPTKSQSFPMQKDDATGTWSVAMPGGWSALQGKNYGYDVTTQEGNHVLRTDPYGRETQGQQRGIAQLYLAARTGQEVNPYFVDPVQQQNGQPSFLPFVRFEVQGHTNASDVTVTLRDDSGHALTKDELSARLGGCDPALVSHYHGDKFNDLYSNCIDSQGRVHLVKQGGAWGTLMNNPKALAGLHYRIEITQLGAEGKPVVVGDKDGDGQLSAAEARQTAFNDPYSDVISPNFGWNRYNVVADPHFDWKNDNAPRMASGPDKMVIYQMHVGSFMGDAQNVHRSNFNDVVEQLQYLKDTGVNTIEMLPTTAYSGLRDWGYAGTNSLAVADQYGFEDTDGRWVSGREALCRLIDTAHGMGFNVYNDMVLNHWGGDYNDMWNTDGNANPYFNWNSDARGPARYVGTPWGNLPAYDKDAVRQFAIDSVMEQLDDLHFDDLRFDFTNAIHDPNSGGGMDGWTMLRKINREVHFFHPKDLTNAEEFPNQAVITQPALGNLAGGAGFDTMWDTEFNIVSSIAEVTRPGLVQEAANGWRTDIDTFMSDLVNHPGFQNQMNQVTIMSDHDEVGNADRTINVAMNEQPYAVPTQWARNASRLSFGVGMLSPGIPLYFQGEESLANNHFSWAVPTTWDSGQDWRQVGQDWNWSQTSFTDAERQKIESVINGQTPSNGLSDTEQKMASYLKGLPADQRSQGEYNIMRREHYNFAKDVTHLRESSPAFDGDAAVQSVYTHNDNSVMAFSRQKGNDTYLVVASLNKNDFSNYYFPIDGGQWQLVLDSDAPQYGGSGFGQNQTVTGGAGAHFDIPAGGMLVFKKVG